MNLISQPTSLEMIARLALGLAVYLFAGLLPACGLVYLIYFVLTIPMRRRERARLFLDLLELGMKDGRTPEVAVQSVAASGDRSLGVRFHLLAAYLEQGLSLTQGMEKVPRLLPPQVVGILKTGQHIGDLGKVLPACRHLLRDSVSHVRGAMNYLVVMSLLATPFSVVVVLMLRVKVLPAFVQVMKGMLPEVGLPPFTRLIFTGNSVSMLIQLLIVLCLWVTLFLYIGGPRVRAKLSSMLGGWEPVSPWRWKRLSRDFSAMLAILLDTGVPEAEAVALAGQSTASPTFSRRANGIVTKLKQGIKLPEALNGLDGRGELQWRIANALHRGHGFLKALNGWHDALDAKAFQQEQAAAQITTASLVLLNGLIIGSIVCAIFLCLISLINGAVLW